MGELVQTFVDTGAGGRGCSDVGSLLPCNIAGCTNLKRRDLGCDQKHRAASGGIPPQGGTGDLRETAMSPRGWNLEINLTKGDYVVSRIGEYGDLHIQGPEYCHTINCDTNYSGPLIGGRAGADIASTYEMLGGGGTGFSGSTRVG